MRRTHTYTYPLFLLLLAGCSSPAATSDGGTDASTPSGVTRAQAEPVVRQYAAGVHASYATLLTATRQMDAAITALLATPSAATLDAARQAWLAARGPYGQTEAFRFYGGPIDDEAMGNREGRINAWPMDENYVDYVADDPTAGIINHPAMFPTLTPELLVSLNEQGGEENIATGWHAIEFMLWGQDRSATGPGARPYTDFVVGAGGTGMNPERRRQYLRLVTDQLLADLAAVDAAWQPGSASNYAGEFVAGAHEVALQRMLTGMGALSGGELAGERMSVAYEERDQEDEQSCFSDNTHNDLIADAVGIQNVYLGRYGADDGPGLDELVRARDPGLDQRMQAALQASVDALRAIPPPFDQAILGADSAPGRTRVAEAIRALRAQTRVTEEVAALLNVRVNLEPAGASDGGT